MREIQMLITALGLGTGLPVQAEATHHHGHTASKYAGEQRRTIKSLSPSDIEELQRGSGWGLAKAAELNGVPGPKHLLELQDAIGLTAGQKAKIQALFESMQSEAITAGQVLIAQETKLEERFKTDIPTVEELGDLLDGIAKARAELRFIHLNAHLKTPEILSADQIQLYNKLRGYGESDPCTNIPEGHPVDMWKKHNGCG